MLRRLAAILLIALALATAVVYAWATMAPLTVSIGSGAVTLVQNGVLNTLGGGDPTGGTVQTALPVNSTAGTALILIAANATTPTGPTVTTPPTGFVKLGSIRESTNSDFEVWVYLNNPGGIGVVTFSTNLTGQWYTHLSEWSNVASASAVEATGTATATSGTTLSPAAVAVLTAGDLALTGWIQKMASGTTTFTTPAGYTRLIDNGSTSGLNHIDVEYQINPTGSLSPTLTSTGTTNATAAGLTLLLKAAPPITDHTAFLKYGSLGVKLNTADFTLTQGGRWLLEADGPGDNSGWLLEDGSGVWLIDTVVPSLGDPVTLANPSWSGRVVSVTRKDITDLVTKYREVTVAATNTAAASATPTAPGDFSDVVTGGHWLLEAGDGAWLLEDGSGYWLLEGSAFAYRNLFVTLSQNQDGTTTTYGTLETYETGFAAGQAFTLTSTNLGYAAAPFTVTNVTQSWEGASATGQPTVLYFIEFGDAYQTLQQAGGGVLTRTASVATQQLGVAQPGGVLGYAQVTANQTGITTVVDLTGLAVTVTVGAGRRIHITGVALFQDGTIDTQVIMSIQEGATVLSQAAIDQGLAASNQTLTATSILTPTTGVHTYKLTAQASAGTVQMTAATTTPAFIMVEDIGT